MLGGDDFVGEAGVGNATCGGDTGGAFDPTAAEAGEEGGLVFTARFAAGGTARLKDGDGVGAVVEAARGFVAVATGDDSAIELATLTV
jgi:hypothetical protein